MAAFARIENDVALDVQPADDEAGYRARFPGLSDTWVVEQVPDWAFGCLNGSVVKVAGEWVKPADPMPDEQIADAVAKPIGDPIAEARALLEDALAKLQ